MFFQFKKNILIITGINLFCFTCLLFSDQSLKKVSFIPLWKPQAQFAGYYVAYEKGIFKKYGLDVTILEGGPGKNPCQLIKSGKADFGILWLSSVLRISNQCSKLVNIAQISQRSALMLIAKKKSGIVKPADMNGRKISLWEGDLQLQPQAFFKQQKIVMKIIPQYYTINLFLNDGVDVVSAMWYNEYHTILNSGINKEELSTFFFSDFGLNFPEDGIYASEEFYNKNPDICRAFVKACLEGWIYAFANENETLDIIMKYMRQANVSANRMHQKWMFERMKDLIIPQENSNKVLGRLDKQDYERVAMELKKNGLLDKITKYEKFARE